MLDLAGLCAVWKGSSSQLDVRGVASERGRISAAVQRCIPFSDFPTGATRKLDRLTAIRCTHHRTHFGSPVWRVIWGCFLTSSVAVASEVTYEYDSDGRLETATYSEGAVVHYDYDANGNRTSVTTTGVTRGSLSLTTPSYNAGEASDQRTVIVNVQRIDGSYGPARVSYATVDGSAVANGASADYVATSGTLTWEHGDAADKSFIVTILEDETIEPTESFSIILSGAVGAALAVPNTGSISVEDDDGDLTPPALPENPTFAEITALSARASWAAATDNVGVTGYRYRVDAGDWQALSNVNLVVLTGLNSATSYTFEVQAGDAAENWSESRFGTFTTNYDTPGAPDQLSFSNIDMTSVTARWNNEPGVTGFQYRLNAGVWQDIARDAGEETAVYLSGLTCGTTYSFEARATNAMGSWGPANFGLFTTVDGCPPSAPGVPAFSSITSTSANVSWAAASDNVGVTGYRYTLNTGAPQLLGNVTSIGLMDLTCFTTYTFAVQARDEAGNWSLSSSGSFRTLDGCPPSAPGLPTFSSITATSAIANWGAASDNVGVIGYRYRLNGGGWISRNASPAPLSGLNCATGYTFEVQAVDDAGSWGASRSGTFTTLDGCPPSAPGTPTFTSVAMNSATASWAASIDNVAVTGYRYSLNSGSWHTLGNVTSVSLTGLAAATAHTFQVQARDAAGNWSASKSGSFTTPDTQAPSAPGAPSVSNISYTSATMSWTAASDNVAVTRYEYRLATSGSFTSVGTARTVNLTSLAAATDYTFQVRAIDAAGNAGGVSTSTFVTAIPAITLPSTYSFDVSGPGGATVQFWLSSGGDLRRNQSGTAALLDFGDWLSPKLAMSRFEVFATLNTGTCSGSPLNTWLNLGSNVYWHTSVTGVRGATRSCAVNLQIRRVGTTTVLDTGVIAAIAVGF